MRSILVPLALLALTAPAFAAGPYTPVKLAAPATVTPPAQLVSMATAFLEAVKKGDGDAIGAAIADKVTLIDGSLDLALPRRKESAGPFKSTEDKLVALSGYIGGDIETGPDGNPSQANQIKAERQYIVDALTDGQAWGTDPMLKGAICSYAYRSYDMQAVKAAAKKLGEQSTSLFYVKTPTPVLKAADKHAEVAATLAPDLLYAIDYQTDAPIYWHAIHLPDGSSGFLSFDKADLHKPYGGGVCFAKGKAGWQMVAQVSTSL